MKRRSRRRAARQSRQLRVARARRWRGAAALVAALAAVALGGYAAARFALRSNAKRAAPPADSLAAMDPIQALNRGVALGRQQRHFESLPYFRRAAAGSAGWLAHWNFAAALNNAAIEVGSRNGLAVPASRAAIERIDLTRRALAEIALAEREAPDRRTVAMLELVRGQTMELWGFPVDALDLYRRAARIDSSSATARRREADCRARLWGEPAPK